MAALLIAGSSVFGAGLDRTFSGDGQQVVDFGMYESASAIAVDSKGRFYVTGEAGFLARFGRDGRLIRSFGQNGVTKRLRGIEPRALAIDRRGRVLVGGSLPRSEGDIAADDFAVMRFLRNGRIDRSFGGGRVVTDIGRYDRVLDVRVTRRGHVVVAGLSEEANEFFPQWVAVARYSPTGRLASRWERNIDQDSAAPATAVVSGLDFGLRGSLLVSGSNGSLLTSNGSPLVVRLKPNGSIDRQFGRRGYLSLPIGGIAYDTFADRRGRILGAGFASGKMLTFRLTPRGRADRTFSRDGIAYASPRRISLARAVAPAGGGRVLIVGEASPGANPTWVAARFQADGDRDPTFGRRGVLVSRFRAERNIPFVAAGYPGRRVIAAGVEGIGERGQDLALVRYR